LREQNFAERTSRQAVLGRDPSLLFVLIRMTLIAFNTPKYYPYFLSQPDLIKIAEESVVLKYYPSSGNSFTSE
jgi:hypothetical protein